jgi:hypothetical protein
MNQRGTAAASASTDRIAFVAAAVGRRPTAANGHDAATMVDPGAKTPDSAEETYGTSAAIRAEALFVSTLQSSESPSPDQVRRAVATTLQRLGIRGCAAQLAGEFGEHPDTAVARMAWALATIRTAYPSPLTIPSGTLRPLALAS